MTSFYVQNSDQWVPQTAVVDANDFDEAFWEARMRHGDKFEEFPVWITDRKSGKRKTVISLCPDCRIHVFEQDEWMITDKVNVYQHVDCHNTERK